MAINIKSIITDTLLSLCERKPLSKLTISDIQEASGVSRQTFYNHFKDKYDLIQYVYETKIIPLWDSPANIDMDYYTSTLTCFQNDIKYANFMQQAVRMSGSSCLSDFMYEHSREFDRVWHQAHYGQSPMPPELVFASDFHSSAAMRMRILWISDGMPIPPEKLAYNILQMRLTSLNQLLFCDLGERSPYVKAAKHIRPLFESWQQMQQV